ncbi:MAG: vitamin K epoxide reductase family protein [Persicimonas sp.]
MAREQPRTSLATHHKQTLWCYWLLILLGLWTVVAPATFGYLGEPSQLGREVWLSQDARGWAMAASDVVSGLLLVVFGWRSLKPDRPKSLWTCCFVGLWMSAAPLLFWAPNSAAYLNATLVGALVVALAVLIPGIPNELKFIKSDASIPEGWSFNPSSWPQRGVLILLAFFGWMVARYLAAYQMGYIDGAFEPFFGHQALGSSLFGGGTHEVLDSELSHGAPVSDGGLGALAYTLEFLLAWAGPTNRWRTMPWLVTLFGILIIPLGLVHVFLVISQPVIVGAWCTLCILAAAIALPMIALAAPEVAAMIQHVKKHVDGGEGFWEVFWKGGQGQEAREDDQSPELTSLADHPGPVARASFWGVSWSWWLYICTGIGVWLMFAPAVFGFDETTAAYLHQVSGALIVTFSVISTSEPIRRARFANILFGLFVAVGPWLVGGIGTTAGILATACGLLVIGLSIPRGRKNHAFGWWDRFVS